MKRAFLVLPLLGALIAPSVVSAQSVAVLGIRSMEGDDEFARNLTGALTHAGSQIGGWAISDREVTLSQMALVHGCDDPHPSCLHEIAASLSVDRLVYGDVSRTSAGDDYQFSVNLHYFDNETGQIEHSVVDTIPRLRQDIDDLREPAQRWIAALSGMPRTGNLIVRVNVPGAEVSVDGNSVGVVDADGTLRVSDVQEGSRQVRVTAAEHTTFTASVSIEAYGEATLEGELQAANGGEPFPVDLVVGSGLMVAAAAFAAVWIYAGATVFSLNNDPTWRGTEGPDGMLRGGIRGLYPESESNLCASAGTVNETETCNQAATLEVLQFVFAGLTAVAGGVGLYFILSGLSGDDEEASDAATLEILPSVGPNHGFLGARVRF